MADTISNDPLDPMPAMVTNEWFDTLPDEALSVILSATVPAGAAPLIAFTEIRHAGGVIRANAGSAANARGRSGEFLLEMGGMVISPELGAALQAHLAATRAALARFVTGAVYLNFMEGAEKQERTHEAYTAADLDRLERIKGELDADNRFCHGFGFTPNND